MNCGIGVAIHGPLHNFEKLDVWNEAIGFADSVYTITRAFPDNERFGLTSQMRRAAVSISSNLNPQPSTLNPPRLQSTLSCSFLWCPILVAIGVHELTK